VISVDTKKKELIGAFKNAGREWQPTGEPVTVNAWTSPTSPRAGDTPPPF
jgi:hypothetical protein